MKKVYGAWAGNPKGIAGNPERCSASVYDSQSRMSHQCHRKAVIQEQDDGWCKIHAPSTKAKKDAAFKKRLDDEDKAREAENAKFELEEFKLSIFDEMKDILDSWRKTYSSFGIGGLGKSDYDAARDRTKDLFSRIEARLSAKQE